MPQERLQKIIAAAGIASRRASEELITAGRVTVNGAVVRELGTKADADTDTITIDGKPLPRREKFLYFLLNKPKGYGNHGERPRRPTHCARPDARGVKERVYPVGRLDYASEGLLLMTNDGALAQKLTKASSHVAKTYLVKVGGKPSEASLNRLRAGVGITLDDGRRVKTSPASVKLADDAPNPWYEVILIEGRNRQIRRMFEGVGHRVEKIRRVKLGTIALDVPPGKYRPLTRQEIEQLKAL